MKVRKEKISIYKKMLMFFLPHFCLKTLRFCHFFSLFMINISVQLISYWLIRKEGGKVCVE